MKTSPKELVARIEATSGRIRELERERDQARMQASSGASSKEDRRKVGEVDVWTREVGKSDAKLLRQLADQMRDKLRSGVVALGAETEDGKALILVAATKDVVEKGFKAGDLIREMAKEVGGSGGGKPDMAQAGGADPSKIPAALQRLYELVKR